MGLGVEQNRPPHALQNSSRLACTVELNMEEQHIKLFF